MKFKDIRDVVDWNVYWLLFVVAELSLLAALPYAITMSGDLLYDMAVFVPHILAAQFARSTVIFMIGIFAGLYLGKKVGLGTPVLSSIFEKKRLPVDFNSTLKFSLIAGILLAILIVILDQFVFSIYSDSLLAYLTTPPLWERILYSFYVSIVEEIVLRFSMMTLLVWIIWKIKKDNEGKATTIGVWSSILLVSLFYVLLNLFFSRESMDSVFALRLSIFNTLGGIVFGWIYWKKGLEYSIITNLTASLMIFVVFGSLVK
jgi:hypothetical protein